MIAPLPDLVARVRAAGGSLALDDGELYVETPKPLPAELIEQLRSAKPALIDLLTEGKAKPDARPGAKAVLLAVPPGVPEQWVQGVADLLTMARPAPWPEDRWAALCEDSFAFLRNHGAEAVRLSWDMLDIFGIDSRAPLARYDAMGLVVLLHGRRVVELHADGAVIQNLRGQRTSFTRHPAPSARVAVWKLDQE